MNDIILYKLLGLLKSLNNKVDRLLVKFELDEPKKVKKQIDIEDCTYIPLDI